MLTELEAYTQAVEWVRDEAARRICCMTDEEYDNLARGFVSGFLHGLRRASGGELIAQDQGSGFLTAENYWRSNFRAALEWDHRLGAEMAG